jgi:HlyB family type I secretion system ABC transporter
MVRQVVSLNRFQPLLEKAIGCTLPGRTASDLYAQIQFIESPLSKAFWQSESAEAGLYVVLAGRIRLIDGDRNYLATVEEGQTFGELTLFPDMAFKPYSARSTKESAIIAFLAKHHLDLLTREHPEILDYLSNQAPKYDSQKHDSQKQNLLPPQIPNQISARPSSQKLVSRSRSNTARPKPEKKPLSQVWPSPKLQAGHLWQRFTRSYPFYAQQSSSDCGAACLVMAAQYWGQQFSVNRIRELANVDRNGASLAGLVTAAEKIGFTANPIKGHLQGLAKTKLPAIAHWEGRHYIVVYAVTRKSVVVCDPAIGQLTLSHAAFKQGWTGYALLLEPTTGLKSTEADKQSFWQFLDLVSPHRVVLLEIFVASIFIQLFGLITPLLTQLLLDRVVVQQSQLTLTTVGFGLLIFSLFRVVMTGLRQYLLDHTANKIDLALIVGFINHTFRLPLKFFETRYVGDILSRVQENQKIQRFLTGEAITFMLDLLTIFVYIGLMLFYNWKMALLVLGVIPPFALLAMFSTPFLQRISREIFISYSEETGYLIQALTGIRTVKSMAAEQVVRWHWENLLNKYVRKSFRGKSISNTLQIVSGTIDALATTGLLWFGASLVIQNELTIGQLVAFNMLLSNVLSPFRRLTVLWNQLQEVMIAIERIKDVLDAEPEEAKWGLNRQSIPRIQGHLRFENVTFRYQSDSERNVLENLNFEVQPGQMVALVGRSGSGKSTLAKLLLNLYAPTEGKIFIDGYDVTHVSAQSLRQQIGVVDQDTFLFSGKIGENIAVTHPDADISQIIQVATLAGAHSFIQELPMGYDSQIGEGGGLLSGGQRQRIAIARALMGKPRLLIFDEATSALDTESESIIQNNLSAIRRDRTTLVIAHRLSTVRQADLILVLDRGAIIEQGSHEELMKQKGLYYYLNQQQLGV